MPCILCGKTKPVLWHLPIATTTFVNLPCPPQLASTLCGTLTTHPPQHPSHADKALQPAFWCYSLPTGLLSYGQMLLENKRLAVVFDLDETLLQALTEKTLRERLGAANEKL